MKKMKFYSNAMKKALTIVSVESQASYIDGTRWTQASGDSDGRTSFLTIEVLTTTATGEKGETFLIDFERDAKGRPQVVRSRKMIG